MSKEKIIELVIIGGISLLPAIIAFISLAFKAGKLTNHVAEIDKDLDEVRKDVKAIPLIFGKLNKIELSIEQLKGAKVSFSNSPMTLNEFGKKVLDQSKIREVIDANYDYILSEVKKKDITNAYRIQESVFEVVKGLKDIPEYTKDIEDRAFRSGVDVDTVLIVGAIDIRDTIITELGCKVEDLDTPDKK